MSWAFRSENDHAVEGEEIVLFQSQMLVDVYHHEGDPYPDLEKFSTEWLTRPNGGEFWVYRQGTFLPNYLLRSDRLYVAWAKTSDLDNSEESLEHYWHIPTISLEATHKFRIAEPERASYQEVRTTQALLHKYIKEYN